jgi:Amt family ammonium transporter
VLTAFVITAWTAVMTTLIALALHKTVGMRASEADERSGLDVTEHAETAYELAMVGGTFHPGARHSMTAAQAVAAYDSTTESGMDDEPVLEAEAARNLGGLP